MLVGSLEAMSPLAVLNRGYSVTKKEGGEVVVSADSVSVGDTVNVLFKDGSADAKILSVRKN